MNWSLNEIESLAKKAARGSGLCWGLAEEAGKATRWLCAMGYPGADMLAGLLEQNDGIAYELLRPQDTSAANWTTAGSSLCPLITGAALCDLAADLASGREITLGHTSCPLLLYPYVAAAADMTGAALSLSWPGAVLTRCQGLSFVDADTDADLLIPAAESVSVAVSAEQRGASLRRVYRGNVGAQSADKLGFFANRTYAPDTPESRLAGAGAGLSDND
ncbi:hypothetical protein PEL8287_01530 [Roseovarius litorisediminis]|uniref:DUF3726 domain-containing protein n=1 Tax=Roseovarius litorisediminis TaxID=1312363 RepID=A0A1Y5S4F1_9RHOB|nr:DUF3726 domain-containing protein [Roseovarius litorisediminis]SLN32364.1 hypothetical protein PEL8287_01530 [Roseovarius litorisediminis]